MKALSWLFKSRIHTAFSVLLVLTFAILGNERVLELLTRTLLEVFSVLLLITGVVYLITFGIAYYEESQREEDSQDEANCNNTTAYERNFNMVNRTMLNVVSFPFRNNVRLIIFLFMLGGVLHALNAKLFPHIAHGLYVVIGAMLPLVLVLIVMGIGMSMLIRAATNKKSSN